LRIHQDRNHILAVLHYGLFRWRHPAVVARHYRLREEADVRRVRSRGRAWAQGPLVARILPNSIEPAQNRYTVIAGKRCGKSVQRNRLKRVTREAIRGFHPYLKQGYDIALICRGTIEELPDLATAQETLQRIFTKASLIDPNRPTDGTQPPAPGEPILTGWSRPRRHALTQEDSEPVQD
jgi:ribonuclease P protein component